MRQRQTLSSRLTSLSLGPNMAADIAAQAARRKLKGEKQ